VVKAWKEKLKLRRDEALKNVDSRIEEANDVIKIAQ